MSNAIQFITGVEGHTARVRRRHARVEEFETVTTKEEARRLVVAAIEAAERSLEDAKVAMMALEMFTDSEDDADASA